MINIIRQYDILIASICIVYTHKFWEYFCYLTYIPFAKIICYTKFFTIHYYLPDRLIFVYLKHMIYENLFYFKSYFLLCQ